LRSSVGIGRIGPLDMHDFILGVYKLEVYHPIKKKWMNKINWRCIADRRGTEDENYIVKIK